MDLKTLEYLKEKVSKADELVKRLNKLQESIDGASLVNSIVFTGGGDFMTVEKPDVVELLVKTLVESAQKEIVALEKELAEL